MCAHSATGINRPDAMRPAEDRRGVIASFTEYLAADVAGHPDSALEAIASLGEWCDGDPPRFAQARAHVLRDARRATLSAQAVLAQNHRDAVELLELVARAS